MKFFDRELFLKLNLFINIESFIYLKYTQWQCKLSFDNSTAMYIEPKNLSPWRDSNPGSYVLEADIGPLCRAARAILKNTEPFCG
jgi:hypothetical protein